MQNQQIKELQDKVVQTFMEGMPDVALEQIEAALPKGFDEYLSQHHFIYTDDLIRQFKLRLLNEAHELYQDKHNEGIETIATLTEQLEMLLKDKRDGAVLWNVHDGIQRAQPLEPYDLDGIIEGLSQDQSIQSKES